MGNYSTMIPVSELSEGLKKPNLQLVKMNRYGFLLSLTFKYYCALLFVGGSSANISYIYYQTRLHSSRMRTARSSNRPGGSPPGPPREEAPP